MLDKPEKAHKLMDLLAAAVPFEIELTAPLIAHLARQDPPIIVQATEIVSKVTYMGDAGGIVCHIQSDRVSDVVIVSLTHLRVHRCHPFAVAVLDYQKHRVKKMRKQFGSA